MMASIEIKADVLKTLIVEDRKEIRGIRLTIYNMVTLLSTASFAITAFLLGDDLKAMQESMLLILVVADVMILALLLGFFIRLKKDLNHCRQCLNARQGLIKKLCTGDELNDFDPFPVAEEQSKPADSSSSKGEETKKSPENQSKPADPGITDSDLWWLPRIASIAIVLKLIVIVIWSLKMAAAQ